MVKKVVKKKSTKKSKVKVKHILEFGSIDYESDCTEFRPVKLDGKLIYKIPQERFMGHMKDRTKEVLEALSKELGVEITKSKLDDIRKCGGFFEI